MQATNLKEVKEVQGVLRDANGTFIAAAYIITLSTWWMLQQPRFTLSERGCFWPSI